MTLCDFGGALYEDLMRAHGPYDPGEYSTCLSWKGGALQPLMERLKEGRGRRLTHGDFWMGNVLFDEQDTERSAGGVASLGGSPTGLSPLRSYHPHSGQVKRP
jgi:hypothetical protein